MKGYKHTELGWIPEEWDLTNLENITLKIGDGLHGTPKYVRSSDYFFVNGNNLVNNEICITESTKCVSKDEYQKHGKNLPLNSLLYSINGTIGNIAYYKGENILLGKSAAYIVCKPEDIDFLFYTLQSERIIDFFNNELTGSTIKNLSLKSLRNTPIAMPFIVERRRISDILKKWDHAISTLTQLISAKQQLKKGLMQQLLTGKKRLPGFEGEWVSKVPLGEIGQIIRGASPRPQGDPRFYGGNIPRLMVEDVTRDGKYVTPRIDYLTELGSTKSRFCKAGTLTIVCSGTVGVPSFLAVDSCIHDGFLAITDLRDDINSDFLYYKLLLLKDTLERSATHGGIFTNLTTQILKNFVISLPILEEQIRIAEILSIADMEELNLKKFLSGIVYSKRALMQQLLTGKKRVKVDPD